MGPTELHRKLAEIFDFNYQSRCLKLFASSRLEEIDFKEHLIIVVCTLELQFFLFDYSDPPSAYSGRGKVIAGVGQTVGVVEDAARKYIKDHTRSNTHVRIVRVLEVFELTVPFRSYLTILQPKEEYDKEPHQLEEYCSVIRVDLRRFIRHGTNTPLQDISAKDSLIIEFGLRNTTALSWVILN